VHIGGYSRAGSDQRWLQSVTVLLAPDRAERRTGALSLQATPRRWDGAV